MFTIYKSYALGMIYINSQMLIVLMQEFLLKVYKCRGKMVSVAMLA